MAEENTSPDTPTPGAAPADAGPAPPAPEDTAAPARPDEDAPPAPEEHTGEPEPTVADRVETTDAHETVAELNAAAEEAPAEAPDVAPQATVTPAEEAAEPEPAPDETPEAAATDEEAAEPEPAPAAAEETTEPEPAPADEDVAVAPAAAIAAPSAAATAVAPSPAAAPTAAEAGPTEPPAETKKKWYVVKIQSGREESIKAAIERKVKIEGLEEFFGQIVIPVEEYVEKKKVSVKDKKTGQKVTQEKNVVKHRKKFPGYLFAEVEFNDRILYLFRETSGVGDFVGATHHRAPTPMTEHEVQAMLTGVVDKDAAKDARRKVKVKLDIEKGDKVRIRDGAFAGSEGEVKEITEAKDPTDTPKVKVEVTIWGRPVPLELDYWHVDKV